MSVVRVVEAAEPPSDDPLCAQLDAMLSRLGARNHPGQRAGDLRPRQRRPRNAGWTVTLIRTGLDDAPHTVAVTTPTGHHHLSRAPTPRENLG